jgi:glycosyltransferase involved in cell wall biosynthesis
MRVIEICEPLREGVGRHVTDVTLGLSRRGHDVHVLYSPFRVDPALVKLLTGVPGVTVAQLPMRREPHWTDLSALLGLLGYLGRHGPVDVIHAHSSKAGAIARLAGLLGTAGIVYSPHAFVTMTESGIPAHRLLAYGWIERALGLLTNRIVCTATAEFQHARERLGLDESRLVVLHNGIDPTTFRSESDLRRECGLAADTPMIGFVGRLEPQKGADIAIRALPSILAASPKTVLAIIGEGRDRAWLESLAASCQVTNAILWLGARPAREYFHNFDVLVCPSRFDGGAYTVIEGLYCGLPVICTPVGSATEVIVHGDNGFIVPPEDPAALAAQTIELLRNADLRERVGAAAGSLGEYFLLDRMLDELEEIYFGRLSGWRPLVVGSHNDGNRMIRENAAP